MDILPGSGVLYPDRCRRAFDPAERVALLSHRPATAFSPEEVGTLVDSICSIAQHQEIFYLWRPIHRDPRDGMVLEVAVAAGCHAIVTFNRRDSCGADRFGLAILAPAELLLQLGGNE